MVGVAKSLTAWGLAFLLGILVGCSQQPPAESRNVWPQTVPPAPGPEPQPRPQSPASVPVVAPAPEKKVIKSWDFVHMEQPSWEWQFPGGTPQQSPNGAFYVTKTKGPGPILRGADVDASDVDYVRVYLSVFKRTGEDLVPINLDRLPLWWATDTDPEQGNNWPFRDEQAISLTHVAAGTPSVFIGKLKGNRNWTGRIDSIAFGLPLPDKDLDPSEQFKIEVAKIEFLQ